MFWLNILNASINKNIWKLTYANDKTRPSQHTSLKRGKEVRKHAMKSIQIDIIIDGSNVAFDNVPKGESPRFQNIMLAVDYYKQKNLQTKIIVDASLRHKIDEKEAFNEALDSKLIRQAPSGVQADEYILKLALAHPNSKIVSNDDFDNWRQNKIGKEYENIKQEVLEKPQRLIKFKINGKFIEFKKTK